MTHKPQAKGSTSNNHRPNPLLKEGPPPQLKTSDSGHVGVSLPTSLHLTKNAHCTCAFYAHRPCEERALVGTTNRAPEGPPVGHSRARTTSPCKPFVVKKSNSSSAPELRENPRPRGMETTASGRCPLRHTVETAPLRGTLRMWCGEVRGVV